MPPNDKSNIDELNKSLYSRNTPDVRTRRKLRFSDMSTDVKSSWEEAGETRDNPVLNKKYEDHSMSFLTKLLIGSVIFCILAVGAGAYLFFRGANLISADNIDIAVSGPISIPGGVPVSFDITVTNKNNIDLQLVDLAVNFPPGTTDSTNPTRELTGYRELLGDIPIGGRSEKTVKAIIFGEENIQKQISFAVTYKIKGSTSSFTKERIYDVLINSSPINMTIESLKEVTSGQEFNLKAKVKSNSAETLKNVLVSASYPFGFDFISSEPKSLVDEGTWRLGDIPPGGERTINIKGKLQGENSDVRVFHFKVGAESNRNTNTIGTEYMKVQQEVAIQKAFITVDLAINGSQGTTPAIGTFNQPTRVELNWFNNLPTAVTDAEIKVKLAGTAYDRTLVQPGNGYYRSSSDEIIWNRQTMPQLASIGAGESGVVSFSVTPRDLSTASRPMTNPTLSFSVSVSGRRTQETGVSESLTATAERTVRVSTKPSLSGRVLRNVGPFVNIGPIPPKADNKTTYTVVWSIDNTVNPLSEAKVSATLPPYVEWLNAVSPSSESIVFSTSTNSITWYAGKVDANTLHGGERKELNFQISVQPSINQVNNIPTIVNDAVMTAKDDFTGETLTSAQSLLTTRFSTDPSYKEGMETVGK